MAEEKTIKTEKKDTAVVEKAAKPVEEKKVEAKPVEAKPVEEKKTETKEVKKEKAPEKKDAKELAIANGPSLVISPKHSFAVCKMIKGKTPDIAIDMLNKVVLGRQPVKMTGREVAHQKGKGIAGAKFPKKAAIAIAEIVRQVKANALSLGVDNPVITLAVANRASAPARKGGTKGKRTHIHLEVRDRTKLTKKKKKK
jgi:ribosomal protein L22